MLLSRTLYRPFYRFDENDNYLIHFMATQLQTFMYFFKFGDDAKVLEPLEYRNYFVMKHEKALENYKKTY